MRIDRVRRTDDREATRLERKRNLSISAFALSINAIHKLPHSDRVRHMKLLKSASIKVQKGVWIFHGKATAEGYLQLQKAGQVLDIIAPWLKGKAPEVDSVTWRDVATLVSPEQEDDWSDYIGTSYKDSFFNDKLSRSLKQANITFISELGDKIAVSYQEHEDADGDLTEVPDFFIDPFDDMRFVSKVWVLLSNHEMGRGGSHPNDAVRLLSEEDCAVTNSQTVCCLRSSLKCNVFRYLLTFLYLNSPLQDLLLEWIFGCSLGLGSSLVVSWFAHIANNMSGNSLCDSRPSCFHLLRHWCL